MKSSVHCCFLAALLVIAGPGKLNADDEEGLIGHWSFDEGQGELARDASGNEHHGRVIGAVWCDGRSGKALQFNGKDAFVDCGTSDKLNLTKAYTIEAWIRPRNPVRHDMTILAKGYRYFGPYHLRMGIPWDHSLLMLVAQAHRTHEISIPYDRWSHVVGVCDGQRVGLFVDGVLRSTRPFVGSLKPNDTPLTIGKCIGAPGGEHFLGVIDEVKIYDRVLREYQLSGTTGREINRKVRTITSRGEWGGYEGFPGVCRAANGDLLGVFFAGRDHMDWPHADLPNRGRICIMRSTDEGLTWSQPVTLIDRPAGERDPSITQLKSGVLICSYYATIWYQQGRVCQLHTVRSFDGGKTWEEQPATVPAPWFTEQQQQAVMDSAGPEAKTASNEHPIVEEYAAINATTRPVRELSDGTLVLAIYGNYGRGPYQCALSRSHDGGQSWGDASMISDEHSHCEPDVIELPDARLLCVMRPCMCQTYSSDKGRTWSTPTGQLPRGDAPSLLLTKSGVLICGHRERPGARTGLVMSTDLGQTWSPPRMLDVAGGAYPAFTELSDGRILCLHYQEALGGNIRQVVFSVDARKQTIQILDHQNR